MSVKTMDFQLLTREMSETPLNGTSPIIHVFVIGFHHKKGCVVEYAYPPLVEGDNVKGGDLPEAWKHLPTLALPDGAHNYEKDTIYFHLPSLENPHQTVFGISCYRQMNAENLLRKSSDITRETVQKSVCVLSKVPLYGLIQAKLELITHAYFDERDFSKVSLLEETFKNLNSSLPKDLSDGQQAFLGLSVRDFVLRFKHKTLLLFKLLLLERKVLFYKAPVKNLCSTVLTLCSLVPGMIEKGLNEAATSWTSRTTPLLTVTEKEDYVEVVYKENNNEKGDVHHCPPPARPSTLSTRRESPNSSDTEGDSWVKVNHLTPDIGSSATSLTSSECCRAADEPDVSELLEEEGRGLGGRSELKFQGEPSEGSLAEAASGLLPALNDGLSNIVSSLRGSRSAAVLPTTAAEGDGRRWSAAPDAQGNSVNVVDIEPDECGLPLCIFSKGMLCHPYLSLPFLDLLNDLNVRGFIVGATNILFKQKKQLFDVIVEVDDGKIEIVDPDLKKQLNLTTEDLRFADHLVRHVMEDRQDVFLDGTGWEGGDEWLRSQFKLYLLSIMRTSEIECCKEVESFNLNFINSWKTTHNYKIWSCSSHLGILEINPGHPFQGQLSMSDMKLKFSHTMQSSERGRRLNSAVLNTGKAVVQTGKAVGKVVRSLMQSQLSPRGGQALVFQSNRKSWTPKKPEKSKKKG